jgi:hypothetical protein
MGFHLAYRIVWWFAVLSNAVAAYFVMIATVTAYVAGYSLNLFDGPVGVGTAGSALLAVIVLVWEWIPGIRRRAMRSSIGSRGGSHLSRILCGPCPLAGSPACRRICFPVATLSPPIGLTTQGFVVLLY